MIDLLHDLSKQKRLTVKLFLGWLHSKSEKKTDKSFFYPGLSFFTRPSRHSTNLLDFFRKATFDCLGNDIPIFSMLWCRYAVLFDLMFFFGKIAYLETGI